MTVKRPPYSIKSRNHIYTAALLQELLDDALGARLDGVAVAGISSNNVPVLRLAGKLKFQPERAYVLTEVLQKEILKLVL